MLNMHLSNRNSVPPQILHLVILRIQFQTLRGENKSAVLFLQRFLNEDYLKQNKDLSKLLQVINGVTFTLG